MSKIQVGQKLAVEKVIVSEAMLDVIPIIDFPVLHSGWEMDDRGWICRVSGTDDLCVVLTNHGKPYIADTETMTDYIRRYTIALQFMTEGIRRSIGLDDFVSGITAEIDAWSSKRSVFITELVTARIEGKDDPEPHDSRD